MHIAAPNSSSNPSANWPTRGPVTPLFRKFIASNTSLMARIIIMSYISIYYAIGSAWILMLATYSLIGWFNGYLDHYYVDCFKIYFSIVIVFQTLGAVSIAILRYHTKCRGLIGAFFENVTWLPLLTVFLGGVAVHVSQTVACHLLSIDMSCSARSKKAENTTFFEEVPRISQKLKFSFVFSFGMIAMDGGVGWCWVAWGQGIGWFCTTGRLWRIGR